MKSPKFWTRELLSDEFLRDAYAAVVVSVASFVFWMWTAGGEGIDDLERLNLDLFDQMRPAVVALLLLRLMVRGIARRHPDRMRWVHRLAAPSNRTALFALVPLVAAVGVLLALSPWAPSHIEAGMWGMQFGLIFAVAGVQSWRKAPFLPRKFHVTVPAANHTPPSSTTIDQSNDANSGEPSRAEVNAPLPRSSGSPRWLGFLAIISGVAALSVVLVLVGEAMLAPYMKWTTVPLLADKTYRDVAYLPDGNSLEVYPGSQIRVRYSLTRREVEIDRGGAVINACPCNRRARDLHPPELAVRAGLALVTVPRPAGPGQDPKNEFFIHRIGEKTEVLASVGYDLVLESTVSTGSGPAASQRQTIHHLKANDLGVVTPTHTEIAPLSLAERNSRTAWQGGAFAFRGTPLADAVAEVNELAEHQFVLDEPALASVPVTANFRMLDLPNLAERFLVALERDGIARRTPEEHAGGPIRLIAFDADPARYGPAQSQVSADVCPSYRGVHELWTNIYDPTNPNPDMKFNLVGCDVATALVGFTQQTGFHYELLNAPTGTVTTRPIKGYYTVRDALATMLDGTGCHASGDVHSGLKIACTQS